MYLVDKGTATNILGEDGLIHWDTFSDVSDKVTQNNFGIARDKGKEDEFGKFLRG